MPVTVIPEHWAEGPATNLRKDNLLVDAVLECQQSIEALEMDNTDDVDSDGTLECVTFITGRLYSAVFKTNGENVVPIGEQ